MQSLRGGGGGGEGDISIGVILRQNGVWVSGISGHLCQTLKTHFRAYKMLVKNIIPFIFLNTVYANFKNIIAYDSKLKYKYKCHDAT